MGQGVIHVEEAAQRAGLGVGQREERGDAGVQPHQQAEGAEQAAHVRQLAHFCDVDEGYAAAEGEGDLSLDYWRQVHRDCFSEELGAIGKAFSEEMTVVCEEFECVFRYEDALRPATGN